jgi:ABC-2 type transport system permease protein
MRNVTAAYVRRDWLVWSSYRFAAFWQVTAVLVVVVGVAFVGDSLVTRTALLNGSQDFPSFVLAGLAFTDALFSGLTGPSRAIRDGQVSGTLEPVLLTPIRTWQLVIASSAFQVLLAFVRATLIITVSVVFLGYWHNANVLGAVLVFVPGFLTFLGLGLLAAGFTMVVKQGDPVVAGYMALSGLLGGTVIPVASLPGWLQAISSLLPLTHALKGLRLALDGAALSQVAPEVAILIVMALIALPLGLYAAHWATERARREGSLVHY